MIDKYYFDAFSERRRNVYEAISSVFDREAYKWLGSSEISEDGAALTIKYGNLIFHVISEMQPVDKAVRFIVFESTIDPNDLGSRISNIVPFLVAVSKIDREDFQFIEGPEFSRERSGVDYAGRNFIERLNKYSYDQNRI